jgi:transposase InsO family protein/transposase-like protein
MYDEETRRRALELIDSGMSPAQASAAMGGRPGKKAVREWARRRAEGSPQRKQVVRLGAEEKVAAVRRVRSGEGAGSVARGLGVCAQTVRNWVRAAARDGEVSLVTEEDARSRVAMRSPGGLPDDPEELRRMVIELQFEVDLRDALLEVVKKDPGADCAKLSNREKAELVGALRPAYSLTFLLPRVGIAGSTYHYQRARIEEGRDPDEDIRAEVARLFEESGGTDGYRRIHAALEVRGDGTRPSEKRVRRVMGQEGLLVAYDRRRLRGYDSYDRAAAEADPDVLPNVPLREDGSHDFSAPAPNVLWLTDVTEFRLPDDARRVYLSPVLDCYDSSIVGWEVALSACSASLTDPSLEMACSCLREGDAPTLHSDGGGQYHAESWKSTCAGHGVARSMSRPGHSPDNSRMEGFFGTLKNLRFHHRDWSGWTADEFVAEVDRWIVEYNEGRRKESLGWKTPMEYRRAALADAA